MDTAQKIVEAAQALIIERGYAGFSYQDVALRVGIRKPSIHHHFPSKAELGTAVISHYRSQMRRAWVALEAGNLNYAAVLKTYIAPMVAFGREHPLACAGGVLGGEYPNLPLSMQTELKAFFDEHEDWLTELLSAGRQAGSFHFHGQERAMARLIFSAIEGALLIKRVRGDAGYFDGIIQTITNLLTK